MTAIEYDCRRCGACCCNPRENRRTGYVDYVAVEAGDKILRQPALMRRYVVLNDDDEPHLKLTGDGRCAALRGALGAKVRCDMYTYRPSPCRRVEAGSAACIRHRIDQGLQ